MNIKRVVNCMVFLAALAWPAAGFAQEMEKMWGESVVKLRAEDAKRGQLFADGNYAMFILAFP